MTSMLLLVFAIVAMACVLNAHAADPHGAPAADRKPNHLINSSNPYLLQHAYNPVDWYPWGAEAFEKAKKENKPIFLSVGYSTCHWCHVMAHESFEDEGVAKILNEHYICIKVDREELPNVDEQYMLATQLSTGSGGWPNSLWLMPDGRPWYAGTYFPKEDRGGRPGFKTVLLELDKAWREQPAQIEARADQFTEAIRKYGSGSHHKQAAALSPEIVDAALDQIRSMYDRVNGGLGSAPKFPPHGSLALLLHHLKTAAKQADPDDRVILTHTLDAMSAGGIYDHLGGGFARYSTDQRWFLPHFEKMLYDNAQLVRAYTDAAALTGNESYKRIVAETFNWLKREMTDPAGGFYSALDADSEGEEGKCYVWTYDELLTVLGKEDGVLFARIYGATQAGNYFEEATRQRTGANILYLTKPIGDVAKELKLDEAELRARLDAMRGKLLEVRRKRIPPHLDDKVLSGWNGLMIAALAHAGKTLENKAYTDAAAAAADFVLTQMRDKDGRLMRTWRKGKTAPVSAYLDDYAFVIDGLLELHAATNDPKRLAQSQELAVRMIADFFDPQFGGFFFTSSRHDALLLRAKELGGGGNIPSGNGVAADVLIRLTLLPKQPVFAPYAARTLRHFAGAMSSSPHGSEALILALARYYDHKAELPPLLSARGGGHVAVAASVSSDHVKPGETIQVTVHIDVADTFHIYASDVDPKKLTPTKVKLIGGPFAAGAIAWPEAKVVTDPVLKEKVAMYEGTVTVVFPVTVSATAADGPAEIVMVIEAQPCDDHACLAPQKRAVTVPVTISRDR